MKTPYLLRERKEHEHSKVTFIELFFDLVFVFAVTQLSHSLLEHLSFTGFLHTIMLMMAVWWVWIYTSWVTNWLDPETTTVRLALLILMGAGLVLSTSLPLAFSARGLHFAVAYVFMQVGRSLFTAWAVRAHHEVNYRSFKRITTWLVASGIFWIAGGLNEGTTRLVLWGVALVIEYAAPAMGFWTPGLGRTPTTDWDVDGAHMAERCGLFIIIALGESILVTGSTFASLYWDAVTIWSAIISFVGSVAMWWIYFDIGAEFGSKRISNSNDPGRIARLAYTYLHVFIVAGIVFIAVGDEILLAHPTHHTSPSAALTILGGPALYLFANAAFKGMMFRAIPRVHVAAGFLLILLALVSGPFMVITSGAVATLVLIAVVCWERYNLSCEEREELLTAEGI